MNRPTDWRKRGISAWLGVIALSMNVLLAFALVAPAGACDKAAAAPELRMIGGGDGGGSPARSNCPVCLTHSLCSGLLLSSSGTLAMPLQAPSARYAASTIFLTNDYQRQQSLPRGPPFAV
jgi:hypothetical protein